ncbi:hypothetical protein CCHR01_19879 [Colletotrichum chrysophilum]|uniref:Uncharacterized protein n=1 Tax=Colletotrichum chrysophilum TaxID=1836956 RepID=A0AAD8ZXT8_9PEZI|nr:hypothetical protein CCHR01_19879 [Colletotrichum chrysophilum]
MLCREIVRKGQREKGHGLDARDWTDMHRAHRGLVWSGLATLSAEVLCIVQLTVAGIYCCGKYLPVMAGPRAGAVQIVLPGDRAIKARREEEEKGRPEAVDTAPGGPGRESGGGKEDLPLPLPLSGRFLTAIGRGPEQPGLRKRKRSRAPRR